MNERLDSLYASTSRFYHATLARVKGFAVKDVRISIPKMPNLSSEHIQMKFQKVVEKGAKLAYYIEKKGSQLAALSHHQKSEDEEERLQPNCSLECKDCGGPEGVLDALKQAQQAEDAVISR